VLRSLPDVAELRRLGVFWNVLKGCEDGQHEDRRRAGGNSGISRSFRTLRPIRGPGTAGQLQHGIRRYALNS